MAAYAWGHVNDDIDSVDKQLDELLQRSERLLDEAKSASVKTWDPASFQKASSNRKLAPQRSERAKSGRTRFVAIGPFVSSTYVSIQATCPSSCPFKSGGCFAKAGSSHLTMNQLDRAARRMTALDVTLREAAILDSQWPNGIPQDGAKGGRDLRLHVGGEVSCSKGASALAAAARRWRERGGGAVWTYTHRWREIRRECWGEINVFASVENPQEIGDALRRGYQAAIVVPSFPNDGLFSVPGSPVTLVACPFETGKDITCSTCRLCLDHDLAGRRQAIAFAVHGAESEMAKRVLPVLK